MVMSASVRPTHGHLWRSRDEANVTATSREDNRTGLHRSQRPNEGGPESLAAKALDQLTGA
jgi:hypothetical protein